MDCTLCRQLFAEFAGKTLLTGFSGGADSTALLLVARKFASEFAIHLIAVHFNHHLRGAESDREAENAAIFAEKHAVEFQQIDLHVPDRGNREDAARACRMSAWKELVAHYHAEAVLLGHHADDKMENFFLRLARGANASGLTSLRESAVIDGVRYLRPLLFFTRAEIIGFLHEEKISAFAEDSSNCDFRYFRNRLRGEILPELYQTSPGGRKGFFASLAVLESEARYLETCAENLFRHGAPHTAEFWRQAPDALLPRLLRLYRKEEIPGGDFIPSAADIRRLRGELQKTVSRARRIRFSGGINMILTRQSLLFEEDPPAPAIWRWHEKSSCFWGKWLLLAVFDPEQTKCSPMEAVFDAGKLPSVLEIALPFPGESMLPFGRKNPEKIKKLRIDRKVPPFPPLPVLRDSQNTVIWAAGIRQSDHCRVDETTGHTVRLTIKAR